MTLEEFLDTVITTPKGYFCLAYRPQNSEWIETYYQWPDQKAVICERARALATDSDVYFSTYLFKAKNSRKESVLPTRTVQADLDNADLATVPIAPHVLIETSTGRHQAYWLLSRDQEQSLDAHEILSRKITYSITGADHSGWPLGRKVRLPETFNYKYLEGPQQVKIIDTRPVGINGGYKLEDFELVPDVAYTERNSQDEDWTPTKVAMGPLRLLESIKDKIPSDVYAGYENRSADRSKALWRLMLTGFKAGLTRDEVFHLAKNSANNKFADLKFHADKELAKDVLRAEQVNLAGLIDVKTTIINIRRGKGPAFFKRAAILKLVIDHLGKIGFFIKTTDELLWYIRRDSGRPIALTPNSTMLSSLLDIEFGLNSTEIEQSYTAVGLVSYCRNLEASHTNATLSYCFDDFILLHTGRRDVFRISPQAIERVVNGAHSILFPWQIANDPITPDFGADIDWGQTLFGPFVHNMTGLSQSEAITLLKVWFIFLLFKNMAISRPILALFGAPGSGKSTLLRCVYGLIYGRRRSVSTITTPDDFDHATASVPLYAMDNVDTWQAWLPDRLAAGTSATDIMKRKLWTDTDIVIMKRQSLLAISAHNPQFGREDVADRLLLLSFERHENWISETSIVDDVINQRNAMWGAICRDVQKVIASPLPSHAEVPQLRVEDFARLGFWIARALGIETQFENSVQGIRTSQRSFSLDQEMILVNAIRSFRNQRNGKEPEWMNAADLWINLEAYSDDPILFTKMYKSAPNLSKKIFSMLDSLRVLFNIEQKYDGINRTRLWRIN